MLPGTEAATLVSYVFPCCTCSAEIKLTVHNGDQAGTARRHFQIIRKGCTHQLYPRTGMSNGFTHKAATE